MNQYLIIKNKRIRVSTNHTYQEGDTDSYKYTGERDLKVFMADGNEEAKKIVSQEIGLSSDIPELYHLQIIPL